jgi:DNA-binding GntR family transcriptional regulator
MALPTAAPPSRTTFVLELLRSGILNGDFPAGRALVESELAVELGVSKTPVREALKTLEGAGLVVIRPYAGASVRSLTEAEVEAIYDMRLLIEPEAVRRSIRNGVDVAAARAALDRAASAPDASGRSTANRDFHRILFAACGNPILTKTLDDLRDQIALVSVSAWARTASWQKEADEHARILESAEAGRADDAAALVAAHIDDFSRRQSREEP